MSSNTKIEWADHSFNPWEGCTKVSPGCDHCYAETRNARFAGGTAVNWGPGAPRRRTSAANWRKPLAWNAAAADFMAAHGRRQRVFCASLADVFDNAIDPDWRNDLADLIQGTPNLDWLLLTKRISNVGPMLQKMFLDGAPPNVWLGATIVNQDEADRDIPKLLRVAVEHRFLSMEPLLGTVDLTAAYLPCRNADEVQMEPSTGAYECCRECDFTGIGPEMGLDWVIVGGESGTGARPMHPDWARGMRDQCAANSVPFLFKQWGEWAPATEGRSVLGKTLTVEGAAPFTDRPQWHRFEDGQQMAKIGKRAAGRQLDGVQHDGFPMVTL